MASVILVSQAVRISGAETGVTGVTTPGPGFLGGPGCFLEKFLGNKLLSTPQYHGWAEGARKSFTQGPTLALGGPGQNRAGRMPRNQRSSVLMGYIIFVYHQWDIKLRQVR